jgi:hypothetical protein
MVGTNPGDRRSSVGIDGRRVRWSFGDHIVLDGIDLVVRRRVFRRVDLLKV